MQSDVSGNVDRLKARMEEHPERYRHDVFQILLDEKEEGTCLDSASCTNGLLWLTRYASFFLIRIPLVYMSSSSSLGMCVIEGTHVFHGTPMYMLSYAIKAHHVVCRAMTFVVTLLEKLLEDHMQMNDQDRSFSEIVSETYSMTLQQYHGWLTSGTFTILLKLVPYKDTFWNSIGVSRDTPEDIESMRAFCEAFEGVLADIYRFLDHHELNNPATV